MTGFRKELEQLINRHSMESGSHTPDFILAHYLAQCLTAFNAAVSWRERWYGRGPVAVPFATEIPAEQLGADVLAVQQETDRCVAEARRVDAAAFTALGWMYAQCCTMLAKGEDPRKADVADMMERATASLGLKK